MISIRELAKQQGGLIGSLAKYDFFWDSLTMLPDFYCSSIKDFEDHQKEIRDERPVLFQELDYIALDGNKILHLSDQTGQMETKLIYDVKRTEKYVDRLRPQSTKELLASLNQGERLYDLHLMHKKGNLYVLGFDTKGPAGYDSAQNNYLEYKFPKLAPVFGNI